MRRNTAADLVMFEVGIAASIEQDGTDTTILSWVELFMEAAPMSANDAARFERDLVAACKRGRLRYLRDLRGAA